MSRPKRMCNKCGEHPATVPDRNRMGRPINRVCKHCHQALLRQDFERILQLENERKRKLNETITTEENY